MLRSEERERESDLLSRNGGEICAHVGSTHMRVDFKSFRWLSSLQQWNLAELNGNGHGGLRIYSWDIKFIYTSEVDFFIGINVVHYG